MVLDRALTDAEVGGNVLARVTGEHEVHDLALARRSGPRWIWLPLPAARKSFVASPACSRASSSSGEQILVAETGFSMKSATCRAPRQRRRSQYLKRRSRRRGKSARDRRPPDDGAPVAPDTVYGGDRFIIPRFFEFSIVATLVPNLSLRLQQ